MQFGVFPVLIDCHVSSVTQIHQPTSTGGNNTDWPPIFVTNMDGDKLIGFSCRMSRQFYGVLGMHTNPFISIKLRHLLLTINIYRNWKRDLSGIRGKSVPFSCTLIQFSYNNDSFKFQLP